ncbi:MAG: MOSC domain-containing protein [Myxococcota bacterium]
MLPRFARVRVEKSDPRGHVELIQVRPKRLAPTIEVDAWDLSTSQDHGGSADRAVTLFQYEHLAVLESLLGHPVSFDQTRRNVAVRGFNLEVARGSELVVGKAVLLLTGRCHPCARMEESLGSGGFAAMFGHGGWTASIVEPGTIRRGDAVRLHVADA